MSISIRTARSDEAALLSALALRSKAYWGYSNDFLKRCIAELTYQSKQIEDERFDFAVAERNGVVAGRFLPLYEITI